MSDTGVAMVTGGGSGIGLAIARALLRDGWRLIVADVSTDALESLRDSLDAADLGRVRVAQMDVSDEASVVAGFEACCRDGFADLRGLVNSAGIGRDVGFYDTSAELFRRILDINLVGTFVVAREAARRMKVLGGGAIVNIASVSALCGNVGRSAYGASKGGVVTLTQVMATELAPDRIRVNAIAPGPVDTLMVKAMHSDSDRAAWLRHIPQRRYAAPGEIASAAVFLLDERLSSFVTGQVLAVDGGFSAAGILPSYP